MEWSQFNRTVPEWYVNAKFGIFIHWGAYSVPAWAQPTGELGDVEDSIWFTNNPYAEWYFNTARIEGSPTWKHHQEVYGGAPYDDFLDAWKAEKYDADDWADLFQRAGARYVIPTTKHHDGITLWDAPGTGTRNTVHRGPKRDLIDELAQATRKKGMRFGVYYSGGLDWHVTDLPPIQNMADVTGLRPNDAAYSMYAHAHCMDLIRRHKPDVLWNDIEWPDFSKIGDENTPYSLANLFKSYYEAVPEGVVDDRWGDTHYDFITSEYQMKTDLEGQGLFENCRGIGFSFGYNRVETEEHYMTPLQLITHLSDIVSRGGNFLLNVGPDASGEIPTIQRQILESLADWMAVNSSAIHDTSPVAEAQPSDDPWVRFTGSADHINAITTARGDVTMTVPSDIVADEATVLGSGPTTVTPNGSSVTVTVNAPGDLPSVVQFRRR